MKRAVARGRMFPQSYSTDRRYGRLSLMAIGLFPLMWSNADDQGRLCGDPEEIKYAVCPNIDHITKEDIPDLLQELQEQKLILCYDTPKSAAIQMLDWWEVQRMQWAWPSEYQPPDDWCDHLRYKKSATEVVSENWPPSQAKPEKLVYFIINDEAKAVKIGVADSPEARLIDLQAASPHKLRIAKIIPQGGYPLEQELHKMFAAFALENEWFQLSKEIQAYLSGESSGETTENSPLTTPSSNNKETIKRNKRGRGRGISPEARFGSQVSAQVRNNPSPSLTDQSEILKELTQCFKTEWGRVPAQEPDKIIPREPGARESAQLRDLAKELSAAGGVPLGYIKEAFREAAGQKKFHISYARAIILDWLGVAR